MISKHNTIRDALFELAEEAFGKSRVGNEPTIYPPGYKHPDANGQRGDVSVMGLRARAIKCIIDAVVPHAESESNLAKSPEAVVRSAQLKKKREYGAVCRARRLHFTPFAVTTSGILAPEAKALLKKFARVLADKWGQPLSVTTNYVLTKVSFAVVKATHDTIFGARARSGFGPCPTTEADLPLGPN